MPLEIHTKQEDREYAIDRGRGIEMYRWKAWRKGRPTVLGYGETEEEAIHDLKYNVQPDHDGTLDGEGVPKGPVIGGNMFPRQQVVDHNKGRFRK